MYTPFSFHSVTVRHFMFMKTINIIIVLLALFTGLANAGLIVPARAQGCLGPAEQQQAINSGQARRFGVIAQSVSKRLNGTVLDGQLCRKGGRLVYILTVVKKNGQTTRTIVDAQSGR